MLRIEGGMLELNGAILIMSSSPSVKVIPDVSGFLQTHLLIILFLFMYI